MSKWLSTRLLNVDMIKYGLLMENIFPFLIINSKEVLSVETLQNYSNICYFNFLKDDKNGGKVENIVSEEFGAMITSELILIRNNKSLNMDIFEYCFNLIMIFRRQMYRYLAISIFCYKVIDIKKHHNYNISDIFDRSLFKTATMKLNFFESEEFCEHFLETSMFIKFIDRAYLILYQKYRENKPICDNQQGLYQIIKTMVNAFDVMPIGKITSKKFFKFESHCIFSSIVVKEEEYKRYREKSKNEVKIDVDLNELFEFFFNNEYEKRSLELLHISGYSLPNQSLSSLTTNTFINKLKIEKNTKKTIGSAHFKEFELKRLIDLNSKEHYEITNDFDNATDIF